MICIAIISVPNSIFSRVLRYSCGEQSNHMGFVDLKHNKFYEMSLLFRRRCWPAYDEKQVTLYKCPVKITTEDLEWQLDHDTDWYGSLEFLALIANRLIPGLDLNFKGAICSEKVEEILNKKGWESPFDKMPLPSDFEKVLDKI